MATPSTAILYDPRYMEFEEWACLVCEQFAAQSLPIPKVGADWHTWAAGLMAIDVFVNQNIPDPYGFEEWQDWAAGVLNVMNGER